MKIGVSVVAYNRSKVLARTLGALREMFHDVLRVVIVDNGSSEDLSVAVRGFPVLRNADNQGLARATNRGLAHLRLMGCDVLVHMDDDAIICGAWVDSAMQIFEKHAEIGMLFPNKYGEFISHGLYDEIRWGLGMFWLLRGDVYDLVGGYDPQLLHQNECDLALRVRMSGYTVGATSVIHVVHNDLGGPRSDISLAREHLGCVQFRDKFCSYFRGRAWNYGTTPLYLMQHWPPDQEWYRRYAEVKGVILNAPAPPGADTVRTVGLTSENVKFVNDPIQIDGLWFMRYVDLRNDYAYWETSDGCMKDRERAIARWRELTGEVYTGYRWPGGLPYAVRDGGM